MDEDFVNLTIDDVLDVIKDFPIELLRNKVAITMNQKIVEEDIDSYSSPTLSEIQYIVAVGNQVPKLNENLKPGAKVLLDVAMMGRETAPGSGRYELNLNPIEIGEYVFQVITDSYIIGIDNR